MNTIFSQFFLFTPHLSCRFLLITCIQLSHGTEIECEKSDTATECVITKVTLKENSQNLSLPTIPSSVSLTDVESVTLKSQKQKFIFLPTELLVIFPNLRNVDIESGIKQLCSEDFPHAIQLHNLVLDSNEIETIDDYTFASQKRLNELSLYGNKLKVIKGNTFKGLDELKTLNLGSNEITTIEDGAFGLPKLEELNLNYNEIKTLPECFFNELPAMRTLRLDLSGIENIDITKFVKLTQLKTLAIGFLNIDLKNVKFDPESPSESALQILRFNGNNLTNAADLEVLHKLFPQLEELDLAYSPLQRFDLDKQKMRDWWPKLHNFTLWRTKVDHKECQQLSQDYYSTLQIRIVCGWQ